MAIQTLVRVETRFNQVIELLQVEKEFRIDSRQVAPNIGIEHKSFVETLRTYRIELEHFGSLPFETAVKKREIGATHETYVMLNRNQVLFAITLSRNTEQVVQWKMALIDALDELEQRLHKPIASRKIALLQAPMSPEEAHNERKQLLLNYLQAHSGQWFSAGTLQKHQKRHRQSMLIEDIRLALAEMLQSGLIECDVQSGRNIYRAVTLEHVLR